MCISANVDAPYIPISEEKGFTALLIRKVRLMSLTIIKTIYAPNRAIQMSTEVVPDKKHGLKRIDEMLACDFKTFVCQLFANTKDIFTKNESAPLLAAADNIDHTNPGFTYLETEIESPITNENLTFSIAIDLDAETYGHLYLIVDDGTIRARRRIMRDDNYDIVEYEDGLAAHEAVRTIAEWAPDVVPAIPTEWFDLTGPLDIDALTANGWYRDWYRD